MRRRNFLLPAVALVGLILFFCFLIRLLLLRYERGDVYPPYSTLRADPLGTRAYYEALDSMNQYPVTRGFTSLHREMGKKPGTLFYLGLNADEGISFAREEIAEIDAYVKNGGRVIITFAPENPETSGSDESKKDAEKKKKAGAEPLKKDAPKPDKNPQAQAPKTDSDQDATEPQTQQEKYEREKLRKEEEDSKDDSDKDSPAWKYHRSLAALWGFGWQLNNDGEGKKPDDHVSDLSSKPDAEKPEVLALRSADGNLEASVPWKSALYFVRLEPDWQQLYAAKGKPVLIRRAWGRGEIIVATDSYLISNEALRNDRRPALLGFLTGPPGRLLFDETHLGTEEQEGVMFLAEKFRLEGYLYGMLGVVLLFLWRNSMPLVPPRASGGHGLLGGTVSGKDSRSGLVNLLRRNIAAGDILKTSFAEWKRNVTPGRRHLHEKRSEMESILSAVEPRQADKMIESYHQLREINTPSRAKGNYATKS